MIEQHCSTENSNTSLSQACIQYQVGHTEWCAQLRDIVCGCTFFHGIGTRPSFPSSARHTPTVLFSQVAFFLSIADCPITFQANTLKGSEYVTQLAMTEQMLYLNCQDLNTGCWTPKSTNTISVTHRLAMETFIQQNSWWHVLCLLGCTFNLHQPIARCL